jgi:mRNA interferase RelE/StbE
LAWTIELSAPAKKELRKLDRQAARRITDFLRTRLAQAEDPRSVGKSLHASLASYWAYRVGDYRLICELQDEVLTVLVVKIGHRSDIYR